MTFSSSSTAPVTETSGKYVAAVEETAGRTGKLSKAEKAELKTKIRTAEKQYNQKYSMVCEEHGKPTTKGRHELTEIKPGLKDVIPDHLENEILAKPFDSTMQTHIHPNLPESINAARKPITFNYEHIIAPEFELHCVKGTVSNKGFHHDYLGKIEKSGFLKIKDKVQLPNGCYSFDWSSQGGKLKSSTFFPTDWTRAQTIEKIGESILPANTLKIKFFKGEKYTHLGLTSEGIPVTSVIKVGENNAKVISAYPDFVAYEEFLKGKT